MADSSFGRTASAVARMCMLSAVGIESKFQPKIGQFSSETVGKGIPTKLRPFVIFEFMENEWEFMKSSY